MKKWTILLVLALLLTGCSEGQTAAQEPTETEETAAAVQVDTSDLFTDRDYRTDYKESDCVVITLAGDTATCGSKAVTVDGGTVTITQAGSYILRGELTDGMVIVNIGKEEKAQLILEDAVITSPTSAAVYVAQADKVFLTCVGESTLRNGGSFTAIDENNIDAVVFSKEDLTLNGTGTLHIISPAGHGVVSKDELTLTSGSYSIQSASHGLSGKDNVCIDGATVSITAGKDGIHGENDEDASLGFVFIAGGSFTIDSQGDGISAASSMTLAGGTYDMITGGGSQNAQTQVSQDWGNFGGMGGMGGMGGNGRRGGGAQNIFSAQDTADSTDSDSIKGVKAAELTILGGTYTLDTADDAFHANGSLTVSGGIFRIAAGDDAFHADEALTIAGGTVDISESYEGLEGKSVTVSGGDITIVSSDDGINAAGGTDQSGFGGMRKQDSFGASSSDCFVDISGGTIYMNASGDGIDANGYFTMSGGNVTVCGPTQGDTAVLDYDTTATISGGTFVGTGAYMMAQSFSESVNQGVIAVSVGTCAAGTEITVTDPEGNVVLSATPKLNFMIAILSCPEMEKGQTYTLTIGSQSKDFTAS